MIKRAKPDLFPIAAVVLLALASGAQANQMSAAPSGDRMTPESTARTRALAAARAFRSEPIPRRRATEK